MTDREVDQQLVERVQRGDKHAFDLLVSKYQRKLGRLISRFVRDPAEAEDVTQDAFIKAYRALPGFRGESAFYTWLYRIGINTAKNYLLATKRRAPTSTSFDAEESESFEEASLLREVNTPENELMSKQVVGVVQASLQQLPEDLRSALTLREIGQEFSGLGKPSRKICDPCWKPVKVRGGNDETKYFCINGRRAV
jgi:RNA polymerase sigma-70 factor (ECF subfamily)